MNPLVVQGAAQLLLGKYKSQKGMLMKNILTMGATGLLIFASLGWYLDWYKVNRVAGPDGKQHITIDLNTQRIQTDFQKGREKVTGYLQPGQTAPPLQQPFPTNFAPQQQPQSPPGYYPPQQPSFPPPTNWAPAAPASRPSGGFVLPGQPGYAPPPPPPQQQFPPPQQQFPGRPF